MTATRMPRATAAAIRLGLSAAAVLWAGSAALAAHPPAAVMPAVAWGELVSASTSFCLDTACGCEAPGCATRARLDLYPCGAYGHNERFRYDGAAHAVRVGPGDDGPGGSSKPNWCLQGAVAAAATDPQQEAAARGRSCPLSSEQAPCNASEPSQYFEYDAATKALRSRSELCLQAGAPVGGNPTVTLATCRADAAAHARWEFTTLSPGLTHQLEIRHLKSDDLDQLSKSDDDASIEPTPRWPAPGSALAELASTHPAHATEGNSARVMSALALKNRGTRPPMRRILNGTGPLGTHGSGTLRSCSEALAGCWPVRANQSRCKLCEGRQQSTLHTAGCTQADIDQYCGTPSGSSRCPEPLAASVNATGLLPVDWFRKTFNVSCDQAVRLAMNMSTQHCGGVLFFASHCTFESTVAVLARMGFRGGDTGSDEFSTAPQVTIHGPAIGPAFLVAHVDNVSPTDSGVLFLCSAIFFEYNNDASLPSDDFAGSFQQPGNSCADDRCHHHRCRPRPTDKCGHQVSNSSPIRLLCLPCVLRPESESALLLLHSAQTQGIGIDNVDLTPDGCNGCNVVLGSNNTALVIENA